ncbi:MAG: tetratricopeptide repeat protein [Pseudomonadales bacterium]|nr:tetratricopeptide repeat protein [Pseudomonadales bacterium]
MFAHNPFQSQVFRALLTYAVGCVVVLQLMDILVEPLGLPVAVIGTVTLLMLVLAPVLVMIVAWASFRKSTQHSGEPDDASDSAVFLIGTAELDTAARQIRFKNKLADVQPKVFDFIEYLIRSRDRAVSKDELMDAVWPNVVVSEASLTQTVKRARDLFRNNGFDTDVIRTVSRTGYQFEHPVTSVKGSSRVPANIWLAVVMPSAAVAVFSGVLAAFIVNTQEATPQRIVSSTDSNSLVVLPFANLTPDPEFNYFSNGLTETLTNSLTTVDGLRVIARNSASSFRNNPDDFGTIQQELNVAHAVQGSVQRDEDLLRVSASLIQVRDGTQLWSQIFTRQLDDVFTLQDEISLAIVQQLSEVLATNLDLPLSISNIADNAQTSEAYRLLLRGTEIRRGRTSSEVLQEAERVFRQALELRPEYPEAMVALSDVLRVRGVLGDLQRENAFSEALSLARDAARLKPDYADAYVHIGEIQHRHFWNFEDAENSYSQALSLNSGSAEAHSAYSRFLSKAGNHDSAVREARIALDLDPRSINAATSLVIRQIRIQELNEARLSLDEFSTRFPADVNIPWLESNWHIRNESFGEALEWIALEELDYLRLSLSAIILNYLGRTGQAETALDELIATDADGAAFQIAEVYAHWQQPDQAFEWLDHAFSQGDPGLSELYSSVNLENLYDDSSFIELAERIGLPLLLQDPQN